MKPSRTSEGAHPSRLSVSEYLAGEAAPTERVALEAHAETCPDCAALLRDALAARDAFAAKYPSLEYFKATRRFRSGQVAPVGAFDRLRALWERVSARPLLAFALILLAVVAVRSPWRSAPSDLSAKGAVKFALFVNGKAAGDSVACKAGDTLQLGIVADRPVHYAVFYRDDEGPLETYMDEGRGSPLGNPGGENLPHSLILNQGWAHERLYCIWSYAPFDAEAARARAEGRPDDSLHLRAFLLLNSP